MGSLWIQSRDNARYKGLKKLHRRKSRQEQGCYLVEGVRLVDEALLRGAEIREVILRASEEALQERYGHWPTLLLDDALYDELADTVQSQGVMATVALPEDPEPDFTRPMLLLDAIQDPGNMGTIIRTALAAGIDQIVTFTGSVDVYNPKVVRSTAGAVFSARLVQGVDGAAFIGTLRQHGYQVIGTALEDSIPCDQARFAVLSAVIIGNEGRGIAPEHLGMTDLNVTIPIRGPVESLNAAIAAGILLYEWGKQLNR